MKRALFLGNRIARYHSSNGVDLQMKRLLEETAELDYAEDLSCLSPQELGRYDLLLSYLEFDGPVPDDGQTAALLGFVAGGGGLMAMHNGISLQSRPELRQLIGGRFTHHPPYEELPPIPYKTIPDCEHPILEGVEDFTIGDEAYMLELEPGAGHTFLLEYEWEGERFPAAWVRRYGLGKVFYTACGHNLAGFCHPANARMLANAARWCLL